MRQNPSAIITPDKICLTKSADDDTPPERIALKLVIDRAAVVGKPRTPI
jgi:hypothetical protein